MNMNTHEFYLNKIKDWEYCYCKSCRRIRGASELTATEEGIACSLCGSLDLEAPGWVICPHQKVSAVKCPRAGSGITKYELGLECKDRCHFRDIQDMQQAHKEQDLPEA